MSRDLVLPCSALAERLADNEHCWCQLFPDRDSWLQGRKGRIGASDAYKVLDGELRKELFDELTGRKTHDYKGNELTQMGHDAEPHVRELMAVENPDWQFYDGGTLLLVSKVWPFASCTLDTVAIHRETGEVWNIEQKECRWQSKWKSEYAPDGYFTQILHQHAVSGIRFCALHPRIYLHHEGGFTTSFERSYEWDMTDAEIAPQVQELMRKELEFHDMVKSGEYRPMLSLPTIF